jgi:hypothetical protein
MYFFENLNLFFKFIFKLFLMMMENNKRNQNFVELDKNTKDALIGVIKKYVNLFKAMHHIDPSIAAEFKKKQDHFHSIKHKEKENKHNHGHIEENSGGCCRSKINNKSKLRNIFDICVIFYHFFHFLKFLPIFMHFFDFLHLFVFSQFFHIYFIFFTNFQHCPKFLLVYIPKDHMNNIEKNLHELYESFYYQSNIDELLNYLNSKFENITKSGRKDGLILDPETEKQLLHRLLIEGVPFYICDKLKTKLKNYEESISEQPMLLAHPSSIKKDDLINFISPDKISEIVKNDYCVIDKKVYPNM